MGIDQGHDVRNLSLGSGILYFDRFDASGLRTGEVDLGNVSKFTTAPENQFKEKWSSREAARHLLANKSTQQGLALSVEGDEFNPYNVALVQMGTVGTLTQSTATVTAEPLTATVKKGRWFPTAKRNISSVVVKQGATTLVSGVDYTVDAVRGRIYFEPGGAATENVAATGDYVAGVVALTTVAPATASQIEGYLRFVPDPTAGPKMEVEIWKVSLMSDGDFGLITEDFGSWSLKAKVLDDSAGHPGQPYGRIIYHGNV